MSVEENIATLRRLYSEVWNKGDMSVIPDLVSDDYRFANFKGSAGFQNLVTTMRGVFPDVHWTIDGIVGEGEWLAVRLSYTGTFLGKLGDTEPTGKGFSATRALFNRFERGKLVEAVPYVDHLALYQQIGFITPNPVEEQNKATIRRVFDECNKGNLGVIDECFADNFVRYDHFGKSMDRAGYKRMSAFIMKSSPDFHVTVDDMVAEGDKVAFRMTITGTNTGAVGPTPPTGKPYTFKEVYFARFEGGKIVEYVNLNRDVSAQ